MKGELTENKKEKELKQEQKGNRKKQRTERE